MQAPGYIQLGALQAGGSLQVVSSSPSGDKQWTFPYRLYTRSREGCRDNTQVVLYYDKTFLSTHQASKAGGRLEY